MSWFKKEDPFLREKVFCIGANKTGTTSLEKALKDFGYKLGDQSTGEMLLKDYGSRNFKPIVDFCHSADAFQDAPFSFPYVFIMLDQYFPNARFILTVRDSSEQWYSSMVNFHSKLFGNGSIPTKEVLQKVVYRYEGHLWDTNRILWNTPEDDVYNRAILIEYYERHNANIRDYFRTKSNFIELNLSVAGEYVRLCKFLGKQPIGTDFPWLNKT